MNFLKSVDWTLTTLLDCGVRMPPFSVGSLSRWELWDSIQRRDDIAFSMRTADICVLDLDWLRVRKSVKICIFQMFPLIIQKPFIEQMLNSTSTHPFQLSELQIPSVNSISTLFYHAVELTLNTDDQLSTVTKG